MTMFKWETAEWRCNGQLVYRVEDFAFDTEKKAKCNSITSVLINEIQLELDNEGYALFVWGLSPFPAWESTEIAPPRGRNGVLRMVGEDLVPGVSIRVNKAERWKVWANQSEGYVCVGDPEHYGEAIQFAPGAIAVLVQDHLVALWLKPLELPSYAAGN